jgi:hypothetical protein
VHVALLDKYAKLARHASFANLHSCSLLGAMVDIRSTTALTLNKSLGKVTPYLIGELLHRTRLIKNLTSGVESHL